MRSYLLRVASQNYLTAIGIDACDWYHCFAFAALGRLINEDMREIFVTEFANEMVKIIETTEKLFDRNFNGMQF